ncbi:MAG: CDGSH iron-sulfur domain-containing protein [Bacteroidota bacterium]
MSSNTEFKVFKNGPLKVSGNYTIIDENGEEIDTNGIAFLCRCGKSTNKPFCDGTHGNSGFSG